MGTAYESISRTTRRQLHGRIAEALIELVPKPTHAPQKAVGTGSKAGSSRGLGSAEWPGQVDFHRPQAREFGSDGQNRLRMLSAEKT